MEIENTSISPYTLENSNTMNLFEVSSDELLIQRFIERKSSKGSKANKTIKAYARDIYEFLHFLQVVTGSNSFPLRNVTYGICNAYVDWLQRKFVTDENDTTQYASSTISRRVKIIKALYTFGLKIKYFESNPWVLIDTPHPNPTGKKMHRVLTVDEIERIQTIARRKIKWDAIVSWFLSTACRREELCNARWKNLRKEETRSKGTIVVWRVYGKGKKEDDLVIHPNTLEKVIRYRQDAGLSIEIGANDETPVFCSEDNRSYSLSGMSKLIKTIGIFSGVPDLSCHWFRHTHATISLADGADIYKVKQQLRHSDLHTTEVYLHDLDKFENTTVDSIKRIRF